MNSRSHSRRPNVLVIAVYVLVCVAAAPIFAHQRQTQPEPTVAEIGRLLASSDIKDQTWGAWWAADQKMAAAEPQLVANLRAALDPSDRRNRYYNQFVLDATLDALIQIGHNSVAADLLESVYTQRQDQAMILAAQSSLPLATIDPLLNRAAAERSGWVRMSSLAAAQLLLIRQSPDTVSRVLRSVSLTAHVVLCDPVGPCEPIRGGYAGSWPSSIPDPAYPPWVHYELVSVDRAAATIVINGPTPATSMSYRRYVGSSAPPTRGPVVATERMAVIGAASGIAMPVLDGAILRVIWQDEASFDDARERFRLDLLQRYAMLLDQLQKAGHLTVTDAASLATPDLKIVVDDRRKRAPMVRGQ